MSRCQQRSLRIWPNEDHQTATKRDCRAAGCWGSLGTPPEFWRSDSAPSLRSPSSPPSSESLHRSSVYCVVVVATCVENADLHNFVFHKDHRRGGNAHPLHGHPGLEPFNDMQGMYPFSHTHRTFPAPPNRMLLALAGLGPAAAHSLLAASVQVKPENSEPPGHGAPFRALFLLRSLFLGLPVTCSEDSHWLLPVCMIGALCGRHSGQLSSNLSCLVASLTFAMFSVLIIDAIAEIGEPASFDQILHSVSSVRTPVSSLNLRSTRRRRFSGLVWRLAVPSSSFLPRSPFVSDSLC